MNAPALRSQMFEALIRAAWLTVLDQACRADSPVPKVAHKPKREKVELVTIPAFGGEATVPKAVGDLLAAGLKVGTVTVVSQPPKPPRARRLSRP